MTYSAAQPFRGTFRVRQHALGSLAEGIYWAQSHWTVREVPLAIHRGGVEPDSLLGSPKLAPAFLSHLEARPDDVFRSREQDVCFHPQMARHRGEIVDRIAGCPDCEGKGTREFVRDRYRFPMWRAITRLARDRVSRPIPIVLLAALIEARWRWQEDPAMLRMLRKLHDEYDTGPQRVSWTAKSEAQQNAEDAA